jgi:hypothetical protein
MSKLYTAVKFDFSYEGQVFYGLNLNFTDRMQILKFPLIIT